MKAEGWVDQTSVELPYLAFVFLRAISTPLVSPTERKQLPIRGNRNVS